MIFALEDHPRFFPLAGHGTKRNRKGGIKLVPQTGRLVYYLFVEVVLDVEDLSVAQNGLLVDLDLTAHIGTRTFHQFQGERAVEVVLVPTPDVLEWNLLKQQEAND